MLVVRVGACARATRALGCPASPRAPRPRHPAPGRVCTAPAGCMHARRPCFSSWSIAL